MKGKVQMQLAGPPRWRLRGLSDSHPQHSLTFLQLTWYGSFVFYTLPVMPKEYLP